MPEVNVEQLQLAIFTISKTVMKEIHLTAVCGCEFLFSPLVMDADGAFVKPCPEHIDHTQK